MKADHFSPDIREFLELLAENEVRYLIVGGEAVIFYGYARLTGDVDLFFEQTEDNVENLFAALSTFWDGDIPGIGGSAELMQPGLIIQFGRPPNRLDLLSSITDVDFQEAWPNRTEVSLDTGADPIPVHFIGLSDLIRNKRSVGRNKDRDDLDYLTGKIEDQD